MPELKRHIGVGRAIAIGLASMIGAGVFFVWAPAAAAAGSALLIGLLIAAVVATLNALSSAQLAMAYPVSGGAYTYGRETIGPIAGFSAGWLFLLGKTASSGAIALIAGSYLWPQFARPVAVLAIVVLAFVNSTGIRSTAAVSFTIVSIVIAGLVVVVAAGFVHGAVHAVHTVPPIAAAVTPTVAGVLQSAALLFFCFAGYARMATLSEEVVDPRRTLPRAILIALGITLVIYAVVGIACITLLGAPALSASSSPLAALAPGGWAPFIRVVAGLGSLGSLAGVLAGLSRTGLAMARERDLPGPLAIVSSRTHAPIVAEVTIAVVAIAGILLLDPTKMVAFSSCAVLVYYSVAQASAFRQAVGQRWLPRWVQVVGFIGCVALVVTLPWQSILATALALAVGLAARAVGVRRRAGRPPASS